MARAGGLDRAGSTAQVSSTEKDEAKHGSNEPDVPMAVKKKNVNRGSRIPTLRTCLLTTAKSSSNWRMPLDVRIQMLQVEWR